MRRIRFTSEGLARLKEDYETLIRSRPLAVEDLRKAREMGDLSENGYYKAARAKLSSIDGRLSQMKLTLKQAVLVNKTTQNEVIGIGSRVKIKSARDTLEFLIAGDTEANPAEEKISLLSPLGKALEGRIKNEKINFRSPSGEIEYEIIEVN